MAPEHDGPGSLRTVHVPDEIAPLFLRAQDYVRRYFADRHEEPEQSRITISGERYVLVRAASMSVEFFDLVTSLYADPATSSTTWPIRWAAPTRGPSRRRWG